ncbi:interleukin-1 receptor type 1 isoform X2 [Brachionichthys hirsutus]|uniref:interleukin-1 receptor type 1 isoform X2 n=1 Tax=Brachionichthys hirsutus TaxID=412623 RepID=UPI003604F37C
MDLRSAPGRLLLCLVLRGIGAERLPGNCTNFLRLRDVSSVLGDVAMLQNPAVSSATPHVISWYDSKTGREVRNQTGRTLVLGDSLWFLNLTLEDDGEYVSVVKKAVRLAVARPPVAEGCGRPKKYNQMLTKGVTDFLVCPLKSHIRKLDRYNVGATLRWFRGCELIEDGTGSFAYRERWKLYIARVEAEHGGSYTCTLNFTLGGVPGSVSDTILASIRGDYSLDPEVHQPANEMIRAEMGAPFTKKCQVFVPCVGKPDANILWLVRGKLVQNTVPSPDVYTTNLHSWSQEVPRKGVWMERLLIFPELRGDDFGTNHVCKTFSFRGSTEGYFKLLPKDPNLVLPIGLVLGGVAVLSIINVLVYHLFKVDIVLWFRRTFPFFYPNKDLDGKLYDAYVAHPPPCSRGFSQEVETFAVNMLPQVLEKACGYKLFIAGRDCLPGQATVDSVEENMQASRRLLLIYTASTFVGKRHPSNNNDVASKNHNGDGGDPESQEAHPDTRQQLECVLAMHRALLEGSLKVILVELEEISPAQLALFPESVRHLRKKQGAVCWWENRRRGRKWRTCMSGRGGEERVARDARLAPPLSPSFGFWKEVRYHMPVRGKRTVYPEKTALLDI